MTHRIVRIRREFVRAALRGCRSPFAPHRTSVRAERKMYDAVTTLTRPVEGLQWQREDLGGVPVERTVSVGANATLIYLHGGAYGRGSAYGYRGVVGRLAEAAWMAAMVPDYSLASEAVALEEMVEVYTALLADGMDPQTTVIAGDSAGGGLALALAMTLRDRGIALPTALGLIRPSITSAVSPLRGNFTGLPPMVLQSAGEDPLVEKIASVATDVERQRFDGLWHDIHLHAGVLAEADFALAELGARLRAHVQGRVGTS
jgi:monoterpene epsilon-lactone hydrolase